MGNSLAAEFGQTSGSFAASLQIQTLGEIGRETSRASLPPNYWNMTADASGVMGTLTDASPITNLSSQDQVQVDEIDNWDLMGTPRPNVFSRENLAASVSWKIKGAGHSDLKAAMTALMGERDEVTGAWGIPIVANPTQVTRHLENIAAIREVPLERIKADFAEYQELAKAREDAGRQMPGYREGPFSETGKVDDVRVPMLSMSAGKGVPDNSMHMASNEQLRFGKFIGDTFGIDPVFGAFLSPTGGIAGSGNREVPGIAMRLAGGKDVVVSHGIAHDAGGYLLNYHQYGPGYQYVPGVQVHVLDKGNPLAGQVDGLIFFNTVRSGDQNSPNGHDKP